MEIHDFIAARKHLAWYVKDPRKLSTEAIVEAVLNYGDWDDVQKLIKILGIKEVAKIFEEGIAKKRSNYRPEISHYFHLYFAKHA